MRDFYRPTPTRSISSPASRTSALVEAPGGSLPCLPIMHALAASPAQPPLEAAHDLIREILGLVPPDRLAEFTARIIAERLTPPAAPNGSAEQPPVTAPPRRKPGRPPGTRPR